MRTVRSGSVVIALAAVAIVVGSLSTWGICPDTSCGEEGGALFVVVERSGLNWGAGILTLILGLALAAIAIDAMRGRERPRAWMASLGASIGAVGVAVAWVVRMYLVPEFLLYGPAFGVFLVLAGGVVAALASPTLRVRSLAAD